MFEVMTKDSETHESKIRLLKQSRLSSFNREETSFYDHTGEKTFEKSSPESTSHKTNHTSLRKFDSKRQASVPKLIIQNLSSKDKTSGLHRFKRAKAVQISYKINSLSDIDEVSSTFEIDIKVFMYWKDELLIGRKEGDYIDYERGTPLFDPNIIVSNEHNLTWVERDCEAKVINSITGAVKRTIHLKGTVFLSSMDLKLFPFDCQNLQVCFRPYRLHKEEVILIPKWKECAVDRSIIHEWEMLGHCIKHFFTDPMTSSTMKSYSSLYVTILVKRKYSWHVNNVFIPTTAFIFISLIVFSYEIDERYERNDILMATLLASISNKFVIGDSIPKVEYRTLLDTYLDFSFGLQLTTIIVNVLVYNCRDTNYGNILNIVMFILEILVAILYFEWIYIKLKNHATNIEIWKANSIMDERDFLSTTATATADIDNNNNNNNGDTDVFNKANDEFISDKKKKFEKSSNFSRLKRFSSKRSISMYIKSQRHSSISKVVKTIRSVSPRLFQGLSDKITDDTLDSVVKENNHFLHFGGNISNNDGNMNEIMTRMKLNTVSQGNLNTLNTINYKAVSETSNLS